MARVVCFKRRLIKPSVVLKGPPVASEAQDLQRSRGGSCPCFLRQPPAGAAWNPLEQCLPGFSASLLQAT